MAKKNFPVLIALFLAVGILFSSAHPAKADEIEEIGKKLDDLKKSLQMSIAATTPLEKNLGALEKTLSEIQGKIKTIEADVALKESEVKEGEELLLVAQDLLGEKVREMYISTSQFSTTKMLLLLGKNLTATLREFGYQKKAIENDRDTIIKVVLYIKDLENKKQALESEKTRLAVIKKETDTQAQFLAKEIAGAKTYQKTLSSQIAQLSARQRDLLAQKLAGLNLPTSLGAGPLYCTDDRKLDPGFGNAFAFFTYGIPHRVGMNQYGAYGRAKSGQNYKDILNAYFGGIGFESGKENIQISIQGNGSKPLDEYLLGIYEMPESWPLEALKAQAVAARSYALAYTGNGSKEICTTQACQVWKPEKKSGAWKDAVEQTKGEVVTHSGQVVTAWYSSTDGGYTYSSADVGWNDRPWTKRLRDTTGDVGGFGDLNDRAYDKESPCFYAAQGFRTEYAKSAWLKNDEVSDIVNVLMLAKSDSGTQSHLSQTDKPNPDGVDTWDKEKVKSELRSRNITPYNSVSGISVDWDKGEGRVTSVNVSGDAGSRSFDGTEFRNFFNLRAPANIQIVGPLYNIERK